MRGMMRRRALLGAAGVGALMLRTGRAASPMVIAESPGASVAAYNMMLCGPHGGRIDRWGRAVAQGLSRTLASQTPIVLRTVGGQDGVTGANRLQTLVVPDGRTAAMMPGEALIAFLAGDPRVHFQPGDWIPVMAGLSAPVLVVRGGMRRLADPAPIKLAAASPEAVDLAAILAFHRLGVATSPIFGLRGASLVARAFADGAVDAVLLSGEDIPADLAPLAAGGGIAIATLGRVDGPDQRRSDRINADVPTLHALAIERRNPPLTPSLEAAYQAVAAASRIDFVMVLPHLTTPGTVALWRQAATEAIGTPSLRAAAAASAIELTAAGAAATAVAPVDVSAASLLALRAFLFRHFGWRSS
ncbi:hypothetical protein [Acidiphilium acidophilum]|uniref:hypothetical protein n=1 Tax=Acidiphilium acidophilum TaxID=76588 RepID=UPI002E8E6AE7|nr:hypothetical protein [Acidiphilium acidophilum]